MEAESSSINQAPREIFFDLAGDDLYINFKQHLNATTTFKNMIRVPSTNQKQINIDLLDKNNKIQLNAINLQKILTQ
jgi:hypothetical protein